MKRSVIRDSIKIVSEGYCALDRLGFGAVERKNVSSKEYKSLCFLARRGIIQLNEYFTDGTRVLVITDIKG